MCLCMYVWLSTEHVYLRLDSQFEYKIEQILTDRNISETDPLIKVTDINSTLILITLQYVNILHMHTLNI